MSEKRVKMRGSSRLFPFSLLGRASDETMGLCVVIKIELVGMGAEQDLIDFLPFVGEIGLNQVRRKNAALHQELVVCL